MKQGQLYNQPSRRPTRKVLAAAAIGTPIATIVAWALGLFNVDVPAEVAAALAALIAAAVGWFTRERWQAPEVVGKGQ